MRPGLTAPAGAAACFAGSRRADPAEVLAEGLAAPKWRSGRAKPRLMTKDPWEELRAELLREEIAPIRINLGSLPAGGSDDLKPVKLSPDPFSAMLYPAA